MKPKFLRRRVYIGRVFNGYGLATSGWYTARLSGGQPLSISSRDKRRLRRALRVSGRLRVMN